MSDRLSVLAVYGTRPEAIKVAPVVAALRRRPERCTVTVCTTGQHRETLAEIVEQLGLVADVDLALMRRDQGLNELAASVLSGVDRLLVELDPDWVLVQGDTTTAMAAGLAAFHRRIRVGHIEAGLRTGDLAAPFPEEANRLVVDLFASAHFAPSERAVATLRREGHDRSVHLVGNSVVDALHKISAGLPEPPPGPAEVLVTMHRRESFGAPLRAVLGALRELAAEFPDVHWVYPVHPNPNVAVPVFAELSGTPNFELLPPLDYRGLVERLRRCRFTLTDSGGIQEEAPAFGKPVLVLRDTTERPEGIDAGVARLVGTDRVRIVAAARELLTSPLAYAAMSRAVNPYGDGRAGERIAAILTGEAWTPFAPPGHVPRSVDAL
jgi:UDP-N-acetylglucosamine 2-epimerase